MNNFITEESLDAMWLNFNDRILQICHHYRIQKKDIAAKIGISPTRLSQRIGNKQHTIAYLILLYYSEINARWLLFGQGEMIDNNDKIHDYDDMATNKPQEKETQQTMSQEYLTLLDRYTALAIENGMLREKLSKE